VINVIVPQNQQIESEGAHIRSCSGQRVPAL